MGAEKYRGPASPPYSPGMMEMSLRFTSFQSMSFFQFSLDRKI